MTSNKSCETMPEKKPLSHFQISLSSFCPFSWGWFTHLCLFWWFYRCFLSVSVFIIIPQPVPIQALNYSNIWNRQHSDGIHVSRVVDQATGSTYARFHLPLSLYKLCACTYVCQSHHVIWRRINSSTLGGRHSTEVAFMLLTQPIRARFSAFPRYFWISNFQKFGSWISWCRRDL